MESRILHVRASEAKDELGGEGEGEATDVGEEVLWIIDQRVEQDLVLQVLVRDVGDGCFDVENAVDGTVYCSPGVAVFLLLMSLCETVVRGSQSASP
jgi:hypothetical protein